MLTAAQSSSGADRTRPPGETSEARIAKALAHPLRARILQRLGERVASPGDLALELGAPLGVVSYHVRMLRDYDCVELVRTEPRRGALQHFYRATARPTLDEDQWKTLPSSLRKELSGETLGAIVDDMRAASEAGTLDDPEVIVQRVPLELPPRPPSSGYKRTPRDMQAFVPDHADALLGQSSQERTRKRSGKRPGKVRAAT
jgi:DNA-binding transcriptional ArsR family regulator